MNGVDTAMRLVALPRPGAAVWACTPDGPIEAWVVRYLPDGRVKVRTPDGHLRIARRIAPRAGRDEGGERDG
jgi:hypothetical protein